MRASELAAKIEGGIQKVKDRIQPWEYGYLTPEAGLELARCLSRLEAAVEALAADAGTGPTRRVAKILEGADNERA